ncbi:hypothetical protein BO70DRAFT_229 [Aspergillus heteromorphus CBS 117.55]|uniref:Uncharacterized protein n=1 Tax=Aspergillus heteromorphus CBS 117.55 TaxID=1448321 RepID=A0A317X4W7_9EURO|nr:uncharacterized protein BO70DRAFT_229 [Aspergillus heteromorphus CBS 117.55]PWY91998.1 hypothetical protein BO70DRAFT_229 [Aspergillus heteromorphus CBS 117.55]
MDVASLHSDVGRFLGRIQMRWRIPKEMIQIQDLAMRRLLLLSLDTLVTQRIIFRGLNGNVRKNKTATGKSQRSSSPGEICLNGTKVGIVSNTEESFTAGWCPQGPRCSVLRAMTYQRLPYAWCRSPTHDNKGDIYNRDFLRKSPSSGPHSKQVLAIIQLLPYPPCQMSITRQMGQKSWSRDCGGQSKDRGCRSLPHANLLLAGAVMLCGSTQRSYRQSLLITLHQRKDPVLRIFLKERADKIEAKVGCQCVILAFNSTGLSLSPSSPSLA